MADTTNIKEPQSSLLLRKAMMDAMSPHLEEATGDYSATFTTTLSAPQESQRIDFPVTQTFSEEEVGPDNPCDFYGQSVDNPLTFTVTGNSSSEMQQYTVPIPASIGTLYGGYFDVTNGIVYQTYLFARMTWGGMGNATAYSTHTRKRVRIASSGDVVVSDEQKCNIAPYGYNGATDASHFYVAADGYAYVYLPSSTPNSTVIQICVPLTNPIPYTNEAVEVTTYAGENSISTDDFPVTVSYWTRPVISGGK